MADEYTRTTDQVRSGYAAVARALHDSDADQEFNRFLAAYEAELRERVAQDIEDLPSRSVAGVPHYAAYIREHAARIARGATR